MRCCNLHFQCKTHHSPPFLPPPSPTCLPNFLPFFPTEGLAQLVPNIQSCILCIFVLRKYRHGPYTQSLSSAVFCSQSVEVGRQCNVLSHKAWRSVGSVVFCSQSIECPHSVEVGRQCSVLFMKRGGRPAVQCSVSQSIECPQRVEVGRQCSVLSTKHRVSTKSGGRSAVQCSVHKA